MIVEHDCLILQMFPMREGERHKEVPMDGINYQPIEREAQRMQVNREELVERIGRAINGDGTIQPLEGLYLSRSSVPFQPIHSVLDPSICMIAQGSKEVLLGASRYCYDSSRYLLATVELPRISQVLEASKERPYLSLRLQLAPSIVSSVVIEAGYASHISPSNYEDMRAMAVSPLDANMLDAFVRLIRLLDAPTEARLLLPLITREIIYRLLMGEQGGRLHHLTISGATPHPLPER